MAEGSAAVTAAQLLAFCKDPVRYRPRLTHGREIPAGGLHAFRFAQGKFPNGLLRDLPAPERERLRRAANLYIRQICFWDGATHYQVLCVPKESRRETIKDHYHGLIALIHPDRQEPDSEHWPPEAAHRVNLAYAVLSDEARRAEYDAELHKAALDRRPQEEEEPPPPRTTSVRVPLHGKFTAARMRLRKPALYGGLAIASLFYLQMWVASQVAGDFSTLQSATPLQLSFQWVRNVFSGVDRPRFLGGAESNAGLQVGGERRTCARGAAAGPCVSARGADTGPAGSTPRGGQGAGDGRRFPRTAGAQRFSDSSREGGNAVHSGRPRAVASRRPEGRCRPGCHAGLGQAIVSPADRGLRVDGNSRVPPRHLLRDRGPGAIPGPVRCGQSRLLGSPGRAPRLRGLLRGNQVTPAARRPHYLGVRPGHGASGGAGAGSWSSTRKSRHASSAWSRWNWMWWIAAATGRSRAFRSSPAKRRAGEPRESCAALGDRSGFALPALARDPRQCRAVRGHRSPEDCDAVGDGRLRAGGAASTGAGRASSHAR